MSENITKKEKNVFSGNQVMMMLEQMNNGIGVIAEGQKQLRNDMDGEFKSLRNDMDGEFKSLRDDMNEGFKKVDEKFEAKFDIVFEFLSRIEDELVDLRKEINILKETKAEDKSVIDLDNRVNILEEKFEAIKAEKTRV